MRWKVGKIEKEEQRLQQEEEKAMAKILYLHKQQRSLKSRALEMLCRGLASLDELDAAEERERKEQEEREVHKRAT